MRTVYRATDTKDSKKVFTGTAKEIVKTMAQSDYIVPNKDVWMYEVQERLRVAYGIRIVVIYGYYTAFLKELKRADIIRLERLVVVTDGSGKDYWENI